MTRGRAARVDVRAGADRGTDRRDDPDRRGRRQSDDDALAMKNRPRAEEADS